SIQGAALIKLQFHPGTDMSQAMSETVAYANRARAFMPPGTVPPFIMRFDAGSVPVGNLVFSSDTRTVGEMQDAALNLVRPLFATLPGVSAPPPFGGSARSIVVNLKPDRLRSYNMSPDEVVTAMTCANTLSPSGNMPISDEYPMVPLNSVVKTIKDLESVPIRTGTYPAVFLLLLRAGDMFVNVVSNHLLSLRPAVLELWSSKQTIIIVTVGGLALAIGILVYWATVCIENIHTHITRGASLFRVNDPATTE